MKRNCIFYGIRADKGRNFHNYLNSSKASKMRNTGRTQDKCQVKTRKINLKENMKKERVKGYNKKLPLTSQYEVEDKCLTKEMSR